MLPTRPLTVLVVNSFAVLGGAESWLLSVLDAQDPVAPRLKVEAILLSDGPLRDEFERRGIAVTVRRTGANGRHIAGSVLWLRRELRKRNPDVALANGVKAAAVACPAARLAGVPCVWVKHDHSFDGRLTRVLGRLSTSVIATVSDVAAAVPRNDIVVLEPPRPGEPLPAPAARDRLAAAGALPQVGENLLIMLGRYVPYKGIDTAIRALAEPDGRNWQLAALGGDEPARPQERQRLAKLAAGLGVADRVSLPGHVPDAAQLLAAADALAVLTRSDGPRTPGREGFGMAALEAAVAGIPVIAVDDGGPVARRVSGSKTHGPAGLLTDGSPTQVAQALARLSNRGTASAMGAAGRAQSAAHHTADRLSAACGDVLALAANRPGAGLISAVPISVVSPVLNEIATLDRLIPPIAAAMGPDDEYLLVDSGSTDGTRETIASWTDRDPRIRLLAIENGTIARSRNAGIAAARHDFIACTDAGCRPDEGWLDGMRAAAAHHRSTAACGAEKPPELFIGVYRAAVRRGRIFEQAMAAVSWPDPVELRRPTIGRTIYGRLLGRQFSPNRVDGRSVGFTRRAWETAGGFPEQLHTAEDEAFGRAVRAAGAVSALTLDAGVTWYQRGRIGATFSQFRGYGKGGGTSRSPKLLAKDGVRVLAYAAAVVAIIVGGWWAAAAVAVAGLAYLWLPLSRVVRRRHWLALPLLPLCAIGKDIAKVLGTTEALLVRPLFSRERA